MENTIDMQQVSELVDQLEIFKSEYIDKVLERRDQMWHKRKGVFKSDEEAQMYEKVRIQGMFLESFYIMLKSLTSCVALSSNVMEEYLGVLDKMQIVQDGKFRESLFSEQRAELERVTDKIKKIYAYNTDAYNKMTN